MCSNKKESRQPVPGLLCYFSFLQQFICIRLKSPFPQFNSTIADFIFSLICLPLRETFEQIVMKILCQIKKMLILFLKGIVNIGIIIDCVKKEKYCFRVLIVRKYHLIKIKRRQL
jgi:hypothetical protein